MRTSISLATVVCASAFAAACGFAETDWYSARAANTVQAYQAFIQKHPKSDRADVARGMMLALMDDQAWHAAQAKNTVDGYQAYLNEFGGGVHAGDARYAIAGLHRAPQTNMARSNE